MEEKKREGMEKKGGLVEVAAPLDRLTPFQNHYCIIWTDVGFSKQIVSQQVSLANRMLRSDATSGWIQSIQMVWAPLFFFLGDGQIVAKGRINLCNLNELGLER